MNNPSPPTRLDPSLPPRLGRQNIYSARPSLSPQTSASDTTTPAALDTIRLVF